MEMSYLFFQKLNGQCP
jgi:hypothetical protein